MHESYIRNHFLKVTENFSGQRIDNFLFVYLKTISKDMIYRIIRTGKIRVNKKRVKFYYKLCLGDLLKIPSIKRVKIRQIPVYSTKQLMCLQNAIVYEDNDLLILNKPAGVAVHDGTGLKFNIIDALRSMLYAKGQFLELIHRLDRDASGLLLLAKNRLVLKYLQKQWNLQKIKKEYIALVCGLWNSYTTFISVPLCKKNIMCGTKMINVAVIDFKDGKLSKTCFQIQEYFKQLATLLKITPITGRTHQIRAHTKYAIHPIIGDYMYGNKKINTQFEQLGLNRLFLHASNIYFVHPNTKKTLQIHAPIDQTFQRCLLFLKELKIYCN